MRPWVSLYISLNLDCLHLVSRVAHPKSLIMSGTLAYQLQFCEQNCVALRWTLSRALKSFFKNGPKSHLHIPGLVVLGMQIDNFSYILWTIRKFALYCTQWFVCFSCCHGNMGWPLKLVTDGNPKVWEAKAINLFQLYTTEDTFSYVRW